VLATDYRRSRLITTASSIEHGNKPPFNCAGLLLGEKLKHPVLCNYTVQFIAEALYPPYEVELKTHGANILLFVAGLLQRLSGLLSTPLPSLGYR
jgi:hypothetical protein